MKHRIVLILLLLALSVKLSRRADDDIVAYRWATAFIVLGATIYYGPLVFAVEAASQSYLAGFGQFFTSNTNVTVALAIMWISMAGVVAVGIWLFVRAWMAASRTMARRMESQRTPPAKEPLPAI